MPGATISVIVNSADTQVLMLLDCTKNDISSNLSLGPPSLSPLTAAA
jgi:hypothetical protein